MSEAAERVFDVAVVGAGPVGSVTALAHARQGYRVALIEANPKGARRLAGEWLHPPALDALGKLGIPIDEWLGGYPTGDGFVVFPEDGSEAIVLPYADGTHGFSCEHVQLVNTLRQAAAGHELVQYLPYTRVTGIDGSILVVTPWWGEGSYRLEAGLIVGADGRRSVVRSRLGLPMVHQPGSGMTGILLEDADLPFEGFGHVFLGAQGPILIYRIGPRKLRLIADLSNSRNGRQGRAIHLWENYGPALPDELRASFKSALIRGRIEMATTTFSPRRDYGKHGCALVGDAVGHYNPLTALGMTLGFADALTLSRCADIPSYGRRRKRDSRAPELIAIGIYEAFSRNDEAPLEVRRAIFDIWRGNLKERVRTMRYLACQDTRLGPFAVSFFRVVSRSLRRLLWSGVVGGRWSASARSITEILMHAKAWLCAAFLRCPYPTEILTEPPVNFTPAQARHLPSDIVQADPGIALARGVKALIDRQDDKGGWEGEVVWCPMLAAQYVITCHITGTPLPVGRRERLLRHFHRTRLGDGLWGLHAHSQPNLYVTTLVYVAARLLEVGRGDRLLRSAGEFISTEGGVTTIPSWGKFWLAMLGLYEWRGLHPILPEAWLLPRWVPLHPSNFYCHTRLIYMGMASIYGRRYQAPPSSIIEALKAELYPGGYGNVDFRASRWKLRQEDLHKEPGVVLRLIYRGAAAIEALHARELRCRTIASLEGRIRWELRTTNHTSISPVSGLLNMIALWLADPKDPDFLLSMERFEGWIWDDETDGVRVAGARSVSWDTSFAVQALMAGNHYKPVRAAATRGARFLASQQIRESFGGHEDAFRIDPKGGWCFAGVWHGWPVSDCTAEAVTALLGVKGAEVDSGAMADAVRFLLRCQNRDGGFGSYEPRRARINLESINPAEMFADSMAEASFVECTASCIIALAEFRRHFPKVFAEEIAEAVDGARRWLRRQQRAEGSWPGAWGIHFIYGTMFGVSGLMAAGAPATDPAIRRACTWVVSRQLADGGWGEHFTSSLRQTYVKHTESQAIQTAWALRTLLEAEHPDWPVIARGARRLAAMQGEDGNWPRQDMAGVFFRTALLDYVLYRSYFPVWALGLFEARRRQRAPFAEVVQTSRAAAE